MTLTGTNKTPPSPRLAFDPQTSMLPMRHLVAQGDKIQILTMSTGQDSSVREFSLQFEINDYYYSPAQSNKVVEFTCSGGGPFENAINTVEKPKGSIVNTIIFQSGARKYIIPLPPTDVKVSQVVCNFLPNEDCKLRVLNESNADTYMTYFSLKPIQHQFPYQSKSYSYSRIIEDLPGRDCFIVTNPHTQLHRWT